jgi:hypothetical protein
MTYINSNEDQSILQSSVELLLAGSEDLDSPTILWSMYYQQDGSLSNNTTLQHGNDGIYQFPSPSLDLSFDDEILDQVKTIWELIPNVRNDGEEFLVFSDRKGEIDEDEFS